MAPVTAVILGAGPHGREIARLYGILGLYDDDPAKKQPPIYHAAPGGDYYIGALWPTVRRQIGAKADTFGLHPMHGNGNVIFPGTHLSAAATLGKHVHLLYRSVISHGCQLGSFVTVCSGAVLCGEVSVGDDVFIGAGAVVIHGGLTIGRGATVGAGAVVLEDVPAGATVVGNPARVLVTS